ncbi:MAG: leucine-rich repeat domain-containing protein [Oscillospiraceae bacterium]|nr:leucine-rich repeat domain-containing protein [Oscillospiraceae bacterium]
MKLKKLAVLLIASLMMLFCIPVSVFAQDTASETAQADVQTYEDGSFTYAYVDGGVALYSCDTSMLAVNLPDESNGRKVVEISDGAFYQCSKLEYITFGKYVKKIGRSAFQGCTSLKSFTVPDTVEEIGSYAFGGCTQLKDLTLPETLREIPEGFCFECIRLENINFPASLETIGVSAFYNCNLLNPPAFPEGLRKISDYAFAFCYAINNAQLPSTVTEVGSAVYSGCINITEFTVPKQLETLGALMFMGCSTLSEFKVEEGNPTYTVKDGVLYKDDMKTLYAYPDGKQDINFTVPEGVTVIYDGAFFSAVNLQEVLFPSTLQYIGAGAFEYCSGLKQVYLPEGVEIIYENAFADCTSLADVHLPETLRGVGNYAFYACTSLKEITIPKNCKTIGEYAFGYTDSGQTDDNGNPVSVKIDGFQQHGTVDISRILFITLGVLAFAGIVFALIRIIKKNQMTPQEKEEIIQADIKAEDAQYVNILNEIDDEQKKNT